jgi:hypothetical protein
MAVTWIPLNVGSFGTPGGEQNPHRTPASTVGRHGGTPPHPDKEQSTINHAADLLERLLDIHDYGRQHLELAND